MITDAVSLKHMVSPPKLNQFPKNLVTIRVLPKSLPDVGPTVKRGTGLY